MGNRDEKPMNPDNDLPSSIPDFDPRQEALAKERAENRQRIEGMNRGERFRMMFGLPPLPTVVHQEEPDR